MILIVGETMLRKIRVLKPFLIMCLCALCAETYGGTSLERPPQPKGPLIEDVQVDFTLLRREAGRWEFLLTTRNTGKEAVFVLSDPVRANGSAGPYINLAEESSTLGISICFYPPPDFDLPTNQTRLTLKRLPAGGVFTEEIVILFPTHQSAPPYDLDVKEITPSAIRFVRAKVGILPDEEGVQDFLRRKEKIGPYATGLEKLNKGAFKGKHLYELQRIITAPDFNT